MGESKVQDCPPNIGLAVLTRTDTGDQEIVGHGVCCGNDKEPHKITKLVAVDVECHACQYAISWKAWQGNVQGTIHYWGPVGVTFDAFDRCLTSDDLQGTIHE